MFTEPCLPRPLYSRLPVLMQSQTLLANIERNKCGRSNACNLPALCPEATVYSLPHCPVKVMKQGLKALSMVLHFRIAHFVSTLQLRCLTCGCTSRAALLYIDLQFLPLLYRPPQFVIDGYGFPFQTSHLLIHYLKEHQTTCGLSQIGHSLSGMHFLYRCELLRSPTRLYVYRLQQEEGKTA